MNIQTDGGTDGGKDGRTVGRGYGVTGCGGVEHIAVIPSLLLDLLAASANIGHKTNQKRKVIAKTIELLNSKKSNTNKTKFS